MSLTLYTRWEHSHINKSEAHSHLVITVRAEASAETRRAPLDLAFALDRSGSMHGMNKLELVKQAVKAAVAQLRDDDRVALVTYDDAVSTRHYLTPLDADHRRHLDRVTEAIHPGGSTNLSGGWQEACNQLEAGKSGQGRIQRAMLLTDGLANVGETRPQQLSAMATERRQSGITTSAIGVGYGFDEILLSGMAEAGGGNFQYIAEAHELEAFFSEEIRSLSTMVAINPFLDISLPTGMSAELINAFPHDQHRNRASVDLRDLAAGEELHLVFAVKARHIRETEIAPDVHLHWTSPHDGAIQEINETSTSLPVRDGAPTRIDEVAEIVAMEVAARENREAVKLDREGRYRESRQRFAASADVLMAAPQSDRVRSEQISASRMAAYAEAPMDEHTRKQTVHAAHMRSRGRGGRSNTPR